MTKHLTCTLTLLLATLTTPIVFAHAHLQHQYPAADAAVDAAPQALTLNFSEGIEPRFSGVTLTDDKQQPVALGAVKRNEKDPTQLIVPMTSSLTAGTYQVKWHVVSVDGHKTEGSYRFSVK
ncbi:CopC domain-containing protein YobA [Leclercia adecarboxylata]|uniref:CopC domain-containing protein YobA n=1 Tax=Leclercia TaxID=83654 RepID=UPI000CD10844|nr:MULTISPECIES: CopC domain-containing protein YobA [Leclercia]POV36244.1 CopC domain-containing protein YobA [Leclercia sp. LSNIH5]POW68812.1 CopC domain-containing protein YobA [Leclercia sp. LSNIH2]HCH41017.1 CopC domain-containing protein YobA [Enterobacter sp.]AUU85951.1 CopC domain-containing protein YobA [Leclercia sp. LSNIH1]MEB5750068.1 CopC domain-containing protein YobA [Leclercia adecarboxylata]